MRNVMLNFMLIIMLIVLSLVIAGKSFAATEYRPYFKEGFGVVDHELENPCGGAIWIRSHQFTDYDYATLDPFYISSDKEDVFLYIKWFNGSSRYEPKQDELEYHQWTKKHRDISWHIPPLWKHEAIYGNCPQCNDYDITIRLKGYEKHDRWRYELSYQCDSCGYADTYRNYSPENTMNELH